jgi:hypothetical protein
MTSYRDLLGQKLVYAAKTIAESVPRLSAEFLDSAWIAGSVTHSKQKAPRRALLKVLILLIQTGAGDEIRTHDPNLGNWSGPFSP